MAYTNELPIERGALVRPRGARRARERRRGSSPATSSRRSAGKPVRDLHHFHEALARHRIGETVEVSVWRDGQTVTLRPVLEEEP